jgi:tetratricopeptide (TPR) repeat protein
MKARLGRDHLDTIRVMNNLAISYAALGRHAEAIKLCEQTLALRKARLGPDHPETLASMNNLAISYVALGRHAEAIKLFEATLTRRKAKLGPDHPDTVGSLFNLGLSYMKVKKFQAAEALFLDLVRPDKSAKSPPTQAQVKAIQHLIRLYDAWGQPDKSVQWRKKLENSKKELKASGA